MDKIITFLLSFAAFLSFYILILITLRPGWFFPDVFETSKIQVTDSRRWRFKKHELNTT